VLLFGVSLICGLVFTEYAIINCSLVGVNLLIGTENGLMLLDRSGQGKVYQLISRRRFQQMEVLEGQNILVTISGKKNRVRVYYLSWLKSKILRTDGGSEVGRSLISNRRGLELLNLLAASGET
jgi:CNH domain